MSNIDDIKRFFESMGMRVFTSCDELTEHLLGKGEAELKKERAKNATRFLMFLRYWTGLCEVNPELESSETVVRLSRDQFRKQLAKTFDRSLDSDTNTLTQTELAGIMRYVTTGQTDGLPCPSAFDDYLGYLVSGMEAEPNARPDRRPDASQKTQADAVGLQLVPSTWYALLGVAVRDWIAEHRDDADYLAVRSAYNTCRTALRQQGVTVPDLFDE